MSGASCFSQVQGVADALERKEQEAERKGDASYALLIFKPRFRAVQLVMFPPKPTPVSWAVNMAAYF